MALMAQMSTQSTFTDPGRTLIFYSILFIVYDNAPELLQFGESERSLYCFWISPELNKTLGLQTK
jgi:hypothetical protein